MSQSTFDQAAAVIFQRCNFWSSLRWVSSRHPRWPRTTSSGPCSNTSPRPPPPPRSSTPPCSSSTSPPPPAPCSSRPPWFSSLLWYSWPAVAVAVNQPHLPFKPLLSSIQFQFASQWSNHVMASLHIQRILRCNDRQWQVVTSRCIVVKFCFVFWLWFLLQTWHLCDKNAGDNKQYW